METEQSDQVWASALAEYESTDRRRPGLYARLYAECDGDEGKVKARYLALRAEQLSREWSDHKASSDTKTALVCAMEARAKDIAIVDAERDIYPHHPQEAIGEDPKLTVPLGVKPQYEQNAETLRLSLRQFFQLPRQSGSIFSLAGLWPIGYLGACGAYSVALQLCLLAFFFRILSQIILVLVAVSGNELYVWFAWALILWPLCGVTVLCGERRNALRQFGGSKFSVPKGICAHLILAGAFGFLEGGFGWLEVSVNRSNREFLILEAAALICLSFVIAVILNVVLRIPAKLTGDSPETALYLS